MTHRTMFVSPKTHDDVDSEYGSKKDVQLII